ncbi:MAG: hypothetical protein AVO39_08765 [delta proteobacterium MLS_D]|jgi:ribosomal protein S17E|nr:MAG: hypothetical protein AVO39_08765 [delta proteobacterium MLS_D]
MDIERGRCLKCEKYDTCRSPCQEVNKILWHDNKCFEKHFSDRIQVYTGSSAVKQFSALNKIDNIFSTDDKIPWSSGDTELRQTAVFIERFFNKVPASELAERYGVTVSTIESLYGSAKKVLFKIIQIMDMRSTGIKRVTNSRFSDREKWFLLVNIFGFQGDEVAEMFKVDHRKVMRVVKSMADKYKEKFIEPTENDLITDPKVKQKLTREDVVGLVKDYQRQGLSVRRACHRIADRQGELVGHEIPWRTIESKYVKAMRASRMSSGR